jgi:uncharacterized phage protein (TIGR01671 family)
MREIKFRAKDLLTGEWHYSRDNWLEQLFSPKLYDCTGEYPGSDKPSIDPSTVGQFTGMVDRNKREIYEGDVVATVVNGCRYVQEVVWSDITNGFSFRSHGCGPMFHKPSCMEVIGNIYDNPELLEQ